ncbi:hypothetical protein B0H14DRAFT_2620904 [Mycena olivaceomarginata]|nr:hypothetical protein B0H14DRAFT_2620904 [Mycena olivaceomarginata]
MTDNWTRGLAVNDTALVQMTRRIRDLAVVNDYTYQSSNEPTRVNAARLHRVKSSARCDVAPYPFGEAFTGHRALAYVLAGGRRARWRERSSGKSVLTLTWKATVHSRSASSKKMKLFATDHKMASHPRPRVQERTLGARGIAEFRRQGREDARARLENMGTGQRDAVLNLQGLAQDDSFEAANHIDMEGVLDGSERVDISHAGGEMGPWEDEIEEGSDGEGPEVKKRKAEDFRTRRDRTEIRNLAFQGQMPEMVAAYIRYCAEQEMPARPRDAPQPGPPTLEEVYKITVVDMFDTSEVDVKLDPRGNGVAPALILEGLVPCAPYQPDVAITVRVLEAFRVLHARAPQLAIQPYVKSLCDLHGCSPSDGDCDGEPTLGKSKEHTDNRDAGDGYFLSRDRVDTWAKTRLAEILPMEANLFWNEEGNPCADRWKNMVSDVASKMWGIFDETGVFLALCRHGFVLVIADMIRSGELAKYPLAVVQELLDVFGMKLGAGYDIGCHFDATVRYSQLGEQARTNKLKCLVGSFHGHAHNRLCQLSFLATYVEGMGLEDLEGCERYFSRSNALAKSCRYASRFHRQQEIATYAKHVDSFETYANLSKFLCTNYRQALTILKTEPALQDWMRQEHVESFDEFHEWLREEKEYLVDLKHAAKTNVETLEMEYVQKLVNLSASEAKYTVVEGLARRARADDAAYTPGVSKAELVRRHAKEKVEKDLESLNVVERWTVASPKWVLTVVEIKKRKYQLVLDALELLIVERIFELTKINQSQTGYKMRKHIAKALQARSKAVKNAIENYNAAAALLDPPMPHLTWEQVVEYAFLADFDILRDTHAEVQSRPWTRPAYRLAMDSYFKILRAREEIKRLNVEIPRVVTWIRDEYKTLRRKEQELSVEAGKTDEQVPESGAVSLTMATCAGSGALAKEPGFTGSLVPGKALEVSAAEREASRVARAAVTRDKREGDAMDVGQLRQGGGGGCLVQVLSSDEEEDGEDEEERVFAHNTASSWRRRAEEDMREGWSDEEGDEELESALSAKLYTLSMLAADGVRGAGGDNER